MKTYKFHEKVVLRTPIYEALKQENLKTFFSKKVNQEILFFSSPDLVKTVIKWLDNGISSAKEENDLIITLTKYYNRIHHRCTPFGLMAGCSVGEWARETDIRLLTREHVGRHTRLDMSYVCSLAEYLAKKTFIKPYLKYFPNSSLYLMGSKIRYVEYHYIRKIRLHNISSVDCSEYVQKVIQAAKYGKEIQQLAELITDEEISIDEATDFIHELIDAQVLVHDLEPSLTGEESTKQIVGLLTEINHAHPHPELSQIISTIAEIKLQIEKLDQQIGNSLDAYDKLFALIKVLEVPFNENTILQTDMVKRAEKMKLSYHYQKDIKEAIGFLERYYLGSFNTRLEQFKQKFSQRYETQEVPLLEILDTESGIGYHSNEIGDYNPLIDNLKVGVAPSQPDIRWSLWHSYLHRKVTSAYLNQERSIDINRDEIAALLAERPEDWGRLPDTFSVMFRHLGEIDGQDRIFLDPKISSSATILLGRFAHTDPHLKALIHDITSCEEGLAPESAYAEIIHLPQSRTGNILMRPIFSKYEIPYLAKAGVSHQNQIELSDLFLSLRHNKFYLRSKKLNKEIIPRLSTAHNYSSNAQPVYQFLCDLQTQRRRTMPLFHWGAIEKQYPYLPRVNFGKVVLSPATWNLEAKEYKNFMNIKDPTCLLVEVESFRKTWRIPKHVVVADGDNELMVDMEVPSHIEMFVRLLKKNTSITIKEFLFDPEKAIVRDSLGNAYTNEFIATLVRQEESGHNHALFL